MPDTQTAHTSEMDSVDLWAKAYACSHMANIETVWALRDGRELPRGWRCSLSLAFIALAAFERRHDDVAHLRDKGPSRRERYHESRDWGGYVYDADQREARGEAR